MKTGSIFLLSILIFSYCTKGSNEKKLLTNLLLSSASSIGTTVQEGLHPDPGSIYLANIKAGKYSIRPAGENKATVSVKIGGTDSASRSVETGLKPASKANGNGNGNSGNNGPQSEGDVDQVWVNIKEIEFLSESGGKTTVSTQQQSVDLIAAKTNASFLFHKAVIPEGKYKEIRLILDDNNGKIVKQGTEYSLKVPSGAQSGLKLKGDVDMVSGLLIELALDFKYESLKYTPGQGYILSPVMNIASSKALLPFVHGMLIVKFKNQISLQNAQTGPTTGIGTVDGILSHYNAILMKQLIEGMPNMDMAVAGEVGLDRVYLAYFRQNQDVILAMMDLAADGNVELVSPNHEMHLAQAASKNIPNDPLINGTTTYVQNFQTFTTQPQNTYLTAINAYEGWTVNTGYNSSKNFKAKIAVIDQGVDDTHPDLQGKVIQNRSFYLGKCDGIAIDPFLGKIYSYQYPCPKNTPSSRPVLGAHGTVCAGIAAANTNNGNGIAGVNWESSILSINVFGDAADAVTQFEETSVGYGIIEAVNKKANILSMSIVQMGYSYCLRNECLHTHPIEFGAIKYAYKKRVIQIAAAGNDSMKIYSYPGTVSQPGIFPASFSEVISVSALTQDGTSRSDFSNFGKIDISAPGEKITTTTYTAQLNQNTYVTAFKGTSLSVPMVAGFAGLVLAVNPNLSPEEVKSAMCRGASQITAIPPVNGIGLPNTDFIGCGRINLGASLKAMQNEIPPPSITTNCISEFGFPPNTCIAGRWFEGFSFQFNAENGVSPYTWSVTNGVLPHNTTLNSSTGVLSGGPTGWFGPGWEFEVTVTDSRGRTDRKTFYFQSSL